MKPMRRNDLVLVLVIIGFVLLLIFGVTDQGTPYPNPPSIITEATP